MTATPCKAMAVSSVSQAADQSKLPDHHRHHRAGSPSRLLPLLALSASLLILIVSFPSLTPHDVDLLASFYHPLLPPLAMLWLWSAAVTCWEFLHVSYEECFPPSQQRFLLTGSQIASVALSLTASAAASAAAFSAAVSWGWWWAASLQPLFLYLLIVALVAMSMGGALHSPSRVFFGRMLVRLMLPVQVRNGVGRVPPASSPTFPAPPPSAPLLRLPDPVFPSVLS